MEFLDNNTPQVEMYNIHAFILALISTNKAEIVDISGYGAIASNGEAANMFSIFCFAYVHYMLQEGVESVGNQLSSGELVRNEIYIFPGRNKLCFYVNPCNRKNL